MAASKKRLIRVAHLASVPDAGYGQRELATDELLSVYEAAGGISID
tara:strand:- start:9187 stop:9324 length:138 start_codon:yes stop_codon:yes gene_type:complete